MHKALETQTVTEFGTYIGPGVTHSHPELVTQGQDDFPINVGTVALGLPVFLLPGSLGNLLAMHPENAVEIAATAMASFVVGAIFAFRTKNSK